MDEPRVTKACSLPESTSVGSVARIADLIGARMCVRKTAIKGDGKDIFIVGIRCADSGCIGEAIKRLTKLRLKLAESGYNIAD